MADTFRKYTECRQPADFDFQFSPYSAALILALVAAVVAPLLVLTNLVLVPIAIGAAILLIAGARFYLYERLVCLGPLQTAIGVVSGVTRASARRTLLDKYGDDDATMGVFLSPGPTDFSSPIDDYWNSSQGELIRPNSAVVNIGLPYASSTGDHRTYVMRLHCEFEGSGVYEFLQWLKLVLVLLLALLALLLLAPQAAALLILFLKLLALLFGSFGLANFFLPGVEGDPTDVNPDLRDLKSGDMVVVTGDWIYDSGHVGWNEIHAVHSCQRMSDGSGVILLKLNPDGTWPADIGGGLGLDAVHLPMTLARWKQAIADATVAVKGGSRNDPANDWILHPIVDGCKSSIIL
jgi:hypothetical protein